MPRSETLDTPTGKLEVYTAPARTLHWLTVALIIVQAPVGLYMAYRGNTLNIWDATTNTLYSSHKLLGVTILAVILVRLAYRLTAGAPADEPTIEPWQKTVSHIVHWLIYALLITVPILGYLGVSYFPALNLFGAFNLPGLVAPHQPTANIVFWWHGTAAFILIGLIALHIAAALHHHTVRKDNVLTRMLPGLAKNKDVA